MSTGDWSPVGVRVRAKVRLVAAGVEWYKPGDLGTITAVVQGRQQANVVFDNGTVRTLGMGHFAVDGPGSKTVGARIKATSSMDDGTGGYLWATGQRGTIKTLAPVCDEVHVMFDRWKGQPDGLISMKIDSTLSPKIDVLAQEGVQVRAKKLLVVAGVEWYKPGDLANMTAVVKGMQTAIIAFDNGTERCLKVYDFAVDGSGTKTVGARIKATRSMDDGTGGYLWATGQRGAIKTLAPVCDEVHVMFDRWKGQTDGLLSMKIDSILWEKIEMPLLGVSLDVESFLKHSAPQQSEPAPALPAALGKPPSHRLEKSWHAVNEERVLTMFTQGAGPDYRVSRVELIRNSRLMRMCSEQLDNLDDRRSGPLAGIFTFKFPPSLAPQDKADKEVLINVLKRTFCTVDWAGQGKGFANVLPVWHGAAEQAIEGIAKVGFASLVNDDAPDPGWHGNGRYNALEAQLAALYATDYPSAKPPNSNGEWVILLSAAIVGIAYPITPSREDFPAGPLPPTDPSDCKFYGHGFRKPCDTHIAGINDSTMICTTPSRASFHEIVSDQDAQLLPLAKVYFKKR